MEIDAEDLLQKAIADGLRGAIQTSFGRYNSPIEKLIDDAVAANESTIRALLVESIASCISDEAFREELRSAVRKHLGKLLVTRFGGELEKQVNNLKSDPTTRARITLAIEQIVKEKVA